MTGEHTIHVEEDRVIVSFSSSPSQFEAQTQLLIFLTLPLMLQEKQGSQIVSDKDLSHVLAGYRATLSNDSTSSEAKAVRRHFPIFTPSASARTSFKDGSDPDCW